VIDGPEQFYVSIVAHKSFELKSLFQISCRPCEKSPERISRWRYHVRSGMTHIAGFERAQLLLLPEAVDDYVEADNSFGSSTPSLIGWILRSPGSRGSKRRRRGVPVMRWATFRSFTSTAI
jgi:hypothetical protein